MSNFLRKQKVASDIVADLICITLFKAGDHTTFNTNYKVQHEGLNIIGLHRLLPLIQAFLNILKNLDSCLWDSSSWAIYVGHTSVIQEVIILYKKRQKKLPVFKHTVKSSPIFAEHTEHQQHKVVAALIRTRRNCESLPDSTFYATA